MFIREVCKRDGKKNKYYISYKLVEAYRSAKGPRQRVLLNLGSRLPLPKDQWKELANRIEEIYIGENSLFPCSGQVERLARHYATLLIRNRSVSIELDETEGQVDPEPSYHCVDLTSVGIEVPRLIGVEHILLETVKSLQLHKALGELGLSKPEINLAIATIIARAAFPASERRTHYYLQYKSALDELLETDFGHLSLYKMYQISDKLLRYKNYIEEHLAQVEKKEFSLKETIFLYDITNSYFEGIAERNPKAQYGRSKEKRSDCPLVSFGMIVDQNGFVKRSLHLPGNVAETKTLKTMISRLSNHQYSLFNPIIVIDAGFASKENLQWLQDQGYSYITIFRKRRREMPDSEEWIKVKDEENNEVKVLMIEDHDSGERHLYCQSTGRKRRESQIKSKAQQRFEESLLKLKNGLNQPYCTKKYEKVLEKIAKLQERNKKISRFYIINVEKCPNTGNAIDITWEVKEESISREFSGTYCLRTDLQSIGAEEMWKIYMMLNEVESGFREMKSELGLRPNYHQLEHRVDGHMWITLLAYHLTHSIRYRLKQRGIHLSWTTIRDRLASQIRATCTMKGEDGTQIHIRTTSSPEEDQKEIYQALNLSLRPLGQTLSK